MSSTGRGRGRGRGGIIDTPQLPVPGEDVHPQSSSDTSAKGRARGRGRPQNTSAEVVPLEEPMQQLDLSDRKSGSANGMQIAKRPHIGKLGALLKLLANHFVINFNDGDVEVYQYDVEMGRVTGMPKALNREESLEIMTKIVDENLNVFYDWNNLAFDNSKILITLSELQIPSSGLTLKTTHRLFKDGGQDVEYFATFKRALSKSSGQPLSVPLTKMDNVRDPSFETRERQNLQALDLILRQGRLFNDTLTWCGRKFYWLGSQYRLDLGCGRELLKGFYVSTRVIDGWKISLNLDVTGSTFYGPMENPSDSIEFACNYMKVNNVSELLQAIADERGFKRLCGEFNGLKLKAMHIGHTFVAKKLSLTSSTTQTFDWNGQEVDLFTYYQKQYNITLKYRHLPLIVKGQKEKERFYPMELCRLAAKQRVPNRKMNENEQALMIKRTAVPPDERLQMILHNLKMAQYETDERLRNFGIQVQLHMLKVDGRVIAPPKLQYSAAKPVEPANGKWNMTRNRLFRGASLLNWVVVCYEREDACNSGSIQRFCNALQDEGTRMGMQMSEAKDCIYLRNVCETQPLFKLFKDRGTQMILVVLPRQYAKDAYAEVKRVGEHELDIVTQCIKSERVWDAARDPAKASQMLANVLLKVNVKLGGINMQIADIDNIAERFLYQPILFVGADVTHPDPGDRRSPSIAALATNLDNHPNQYLGIELIQENRKEIIQELTAAMIQALRAYERQSRAKPDRIIFYRDGVGEGQFGEVLVEELKAIQRACLKMENGYKPSITFIVVQKRHHTRFFKEYIDPRAKIPEKNIPAGTVVDMGVTHPVEFDFYLCSHQGIQGTSKPTHYHVLWDDNNFTADDLQALTYRLCHTELEREQGSQSSGSSGEEEYDLKRLTSIIQIKPNMQKTMYWQ